MKIVALFPYNFGAANFDLVFWGDPEKGLWGRGPTAVKEFLESDAKCLLIGGGAALVDDGSGVKRSESIIEYEILRDRFHKLTLIEAEEIAKLRDRFFVNNISPIVIDYYFGKNTSTVAAWVRRVFNLYDRGDPHNEVIVVADPAHLRALLCTQAAFKDLIPKVKVVFVPSDIPYAGEPGDAMIFEAPALEKPGVREQLQSIIDDIKEEPSIATEGRVQT